MSTVAGTDHIANAVQANILAATAGDEAKNQVYNVAVGDRTTLNDLFYALQDTLVASGVAIKQKPIYREFRPGDVRHSQADISKASRLLGYQPTHVIRAGIAEAMQWYVSGTG